MVNIGGDRGDRGGVGVGDDSMHEFTLGVVCDLCGLCLSLLGSSLRTSSFGLKVDGVVSW